MPTLPTLPYFLPGSCARNRYPHYCMLLVEIHVASGYDAKVSKVLQGGSSSFLQIEALHGEAHWADHLIAKQGSRLGVGKTVRLTTIIISFPATTNCELNTDASRLGKWRQSERKTPLDNRTEEPPYSLMIGFYQHHHNSNTTEQNRHKKEEKVSTIL